jgi:hypothetical protein
MSERNEKSLSELERSLAELTPSAAGLDRDRLMYAAGKAAATPRLRYAWPAASGALTALAASLALVLIMRPAPEIRIVHVPVQVVPAVPEPEDIDAPPAAVPEPARPISPFSYWRLQESAVQHGLDAPPDPPVDAAPPRTSSPGQPVSAWDWRTRSPFIASLIETGGN